MQVLIRKARVSDPGSPHHNKVVDLLVENGVIAKIAASIKAPEATVVSAKGLCVSSGWVDIFADYREPGYEHKETIASGLRTAASGGFTDVLLAPNTQPALSSKSVIQYIRQQAAGNIVNLHPIGTASKDAAGNELAEMLDMRTNGAIAFSDGWTPIQSANLMLKALEYISAFEGTLIQMPIDSGLAAGGLMHEGVVSTGLGMAGIPELAETLMVYRDIELVRYTGSKLHITGVTTAASVEMIRKAKAEGLNVTCSVTPYHLALTDESLKGYDSVYKVSPPLRGAADRQALIAGLKDGTIDCIASHHNPHEEDAKAKEFDYAAAGMAVQESAYNVVWGAVSKVMDIDQVVATMSRLPRAIFGLPAATIEKGGIAALTLFTTEGLHTLKAANAKSTGVNNPFMDVAMTGKVIGVINNNKLHLNN